MFFHRQFEEFDPKVGDVPSHPFSYLPEIAYRARVLLNYRTNEQITHIAERVSSEVDGYFSDLKYIAISDLKKKLDGNEEAFETFFDWDGGSVANGRWLFKEAMEDELEIPTEKNTSEVDALKNIIENRDSCFFLPEGSPEPEREEWEEGTRHELFAVLALWLLADTLETARDARSQFALSIAGEYAIKAMDAVCYAESLRAEDELVSFIKKSNDKGLAEALHDQREELHERHRKFQKLRLDQERNQKSNLARRAANALHSRQGGSREKNEKIRGLWASGKYTSRDICAEQECAGLDMSFQPHARR